MVFGTRNTHGRECGLPLRPPLLCLTTAADMSRPSPPSGMVSRELASSPHVSLNFYEINSVYVSLNVILALGSCLLISLLISSYTIFVKCEGSAV